MKKFGIIGGGAWGTALAQIIVTSQQAVLLWLRDQKQTELLNTTHENKQYLPGIKLDKGIRAVNQLIDLLNSDVFVIAVPAQKTREILQSIASNIKPETPFILTSKGLEQKSLKFQHEVLKDVIPTARPFILSGPSFAKDVAKGLPTAIVLAESERTNPSDPKNITANELIQLIGKKTFRPYLSKDILGVEIGGCVKNVLAIACGIVAGKQLGASAHAALMTRGFAEMMRLGRALGAKTETLTGLSGLGDLTLSCFSPLSRNMQCGIRLGRGETLETIIKTSHSIEGIATAPALLELAKRHQIDMPITQSINAIISNQKTVHLVIDELLSRPFKEESLIGNRLLR